MTLDRTSVDGVTVGVGNGRLTLAEIWECFSDMWRLHDGPATRILWDLRDAEFNLSEREVRDSADFAKQNSPYRDVRMAFVVDKDLQFGLLRMWEVFRDDEGARVSVFRDKDEALEWLGSGST